MLKKQLSCNSESFETQNPAAKCVFFINSTLENGTSVNEVFHFKANDSLTKSHKITSKINPVNSIQPQKQAESHFTAFSPTFQSPTNYSNTYKLNPQQNSGANPTQKQSKFIPNAPQINISDMSTQLKPERIFKDIPKEAAQISSSPARFSSPKLLSPVKHSQKFGISHQITQPSSEKLILATAKSPQPLTSPVFSSEKQNSCSKWFCGLPSCARRSNFV